MKTARPSNDQPEIELRTEGLSLRFSRAGDRFKLSLLVDGNPLLGAVDAGESDSWPAAPPLQQLHEQVLATGPVVLGVGAAGTTHWSASFAAKESGVVWCEYAARVSRAWEPDSQWLGTSFQIASGWNLSVAEQELVLDNQSLRIHLQKLGPESQLFSSQFGTIAISPVKNRDLRTNTIQWRFALFLERG